MFITHLIGIDHRFPVLRQEIVFRPQRVGRPTFDQVIDEARNAGLNVFLLEFLCRDLSSINSCNIVEDETFGRGNRSHRNILRNRKIIFLESRRIIRMGHHSKCQ